MKLNAEIIIFVLVALFWTVRAIFRFFKWAGRQLKGGAVDANPARLAPPPSPTPPPSQAPPPSKTLPTRMPALAPARPMPRQPQAGGSAVPREATERDFWRQEEELVAYEPPALGVSLQSPTPSIVPVAKLFGSNDDLVRAIILQEALGPPLSRRHIPSAPPPPIPS